MYKDQSKAKTGRSVVVSISEIQGYTEHVTSSDYGNRSLYTLKVDVAPKIHIVLKPNSQCSCIWKWGPLEEEVRS